MKRIVVLLTVVALMVVMVAMSVASASAVPSQANPQVSQGKADPPTFQAQNGCNGFSQTPTNEPPFFQSSHVTC